MDDGVDFDARTITVQEIREQAEYPGLRLRMKATIGPWVGVAAWDISTGDPIVPQPEVALGAIAPGDIGYGDHRTAEVGGLAPQRGT